MGRSVNDSFFFPAEVKSPGRQQKAADLARVLWRVVQLRPECALGQAHMLRDSFLRSAATVVLLPRAELGPALHDLLLANGRYRVPNFQAFADAVRKQFSRELDYRADRSRQFSGDLLFQTIELVSLNKSEAAAEGTIRGMGAGGGLSLDDRDRNQMLLHFRAYVDIQKRIKAAGNVKRALDQKEDLLLSAARANPEITLSALAEMLRNIVAQHLLSMKYTCDTLMVEWMKEYGFGPLHMLKVSRLIPFETGLGQFRITYAAAIRNLRDAALDGDRIDSDMFLLRSLSNFYTSWTMKVAELVPA